MASLAKAPQVTRELVDAFYDAYTRRDVFALAPLVDDEVTWAINGPVELLQFCGTHRGKAAVLDMVRRLVPQVFEIVSFVADIVLIDGDRVATWNRLTGRRPTDGRIISYRVAQFIHFRNGKIRDYCSVIDSFDAAQQVLGHPLAFNEELAAEGNLVAL